MDEQTHVSAEKIGVVAETVTIEHQTIASTTEVNATTVTIINYAPTTPHQPSKSPNAQTKPANPYKGLAHFGPADAALFFGRDELIEQLLKTISANTFTAIIGPSGSAKSSVVLAGVAPRLSEKGGWLFSYFRVSDSSLKDPFLAMMQALTPFYAKDLDDADR